MSDCVVWERPLVGVTEVCANGTDGVDVGVTAAAVRGVLDAGGDGTDAGVADEGVADEGVDAVIAGLVELGRGAQASSSNPLEAVAGATLVFEG